ncbi:hypothetical protein HYH03_013596 [Edaphochlamys debaryana]|uniref:Uncharacterized protein n=1 Tax=Edaphochlamys debaryana TaxID=47281 RepID=A0A836BSR6_9CHLO|nr:hypothetical protein HYH03_013596 [Edaphochlamys debaryana]|eukprot:KAG2487751.1 hypothetical protein HYH03_013596 [Edaphochlamys debaryana]
MSLQIYPHAHKSVSVWSTGRSTTVALLEDVANERAICIVYATPESTPAPGEDLALSEDDVKVCLKHPSVLRRDDLQMRTHGEIIFQEDGRERPDSQERAVFASYATYDPAEADMVDYMLVGNVERVFDMLDALDSADSTLTYLRLLTVAWHFGPAVVDVLLQRRQVYLNRERFTVRADMRTVGTEIARFLLPDALAVATHLPEEEYVNLYDELGALVKRDKRLDTYNALWHAVMANRADLVRFLLAMACDADALIGKDAVERCMAWSKSAEVKAELESYHATHFCRGKEEV